MSYIRFTADSLTEDQAAIISAVVELFCENVIVEDDDFDCTYYKTELGESYEFALAEDLDERVVEVIIESLSNYIEDFTVEATGQ